MSPSRNVPDAATAHMLSESELQEARMRHVTQYAVDPRSAKDGDNRFSYHPPHGDQPARYDALRAHARDLAKHITSVTPPSREQSLALTKLQEAVMWANAAIACNEPHNVDPTAAP